MLLTIPVKPHTIKFLTRHLGEGYKMHLDDAYGMYLYGLLSKRRKVARREDKLTRYTASFPVEVSLSRLKKNAHTNLTAAAVVSFNNFAEKVCYGEFFALVDVLTTHTDKSIQFGIDEFKKKFDLTEDELADDTLRRAYLRYRATVREQRKIFQEVA